MRSSLSESVTITEFQATEAYTSLNLTKAKYHISRLAMVENKMKIIIIIINTLI
jgi:hypothetical protein